MRLALHELRRNPGRFFVATVTISLIAILLFFLGALLDGLLQLSTGAYQAQRGQLVVMSQDAKGVLGASRLDSQIRGDVTEALRVTGEPTVSVGAQARITPRPSQSPSWNACSQSARQASLPTRSPVQAQPSSPRGTSGVRRSGSSSRSATAR